MRFCLINPPWSFEGSIYFGCREPHLPLEYGYSKALLERAGHEVQIVDAQMDGLPAAEVHDRVADFRPDFTVVTTAPSYLFWRCAPPELRVPQETMRALAQVPGLRIVVGPHASTTPAATLRKLHADVVVIGECQEILPQLASDPSEWSAIPSIAFVQSGEVQVTGGPHQTNMSALPALRWSADDIRHHYHHHHRFDASPSGPGA